MSAFEVDFLTDGGQTAETVTAALVAFIAAATRSLDVAIYDFHAREGASARIADALEAGAARGVAVRVAFNVDRPRRPSAPRPMEANPDEIDGLEVPTRGVRDENALMHHKFVVRDGEDVWTGSTNWTDDAFTREENAVIRVSSPSIAGDYTRDFEKLWTHRRVDPSGGAGVVTTLDGGVTIRPYFSPKGPSLAHLLAERLGALGPRQPLEDRGVGGDRTAPLRQALDAVRRGRRPRLHAREVDRGRRRGPHRQLQLLTQRREQRRERPAHHGRAHRRALRSVHRCGRRPLRGDAGSQPKEQSTMTLFRACSSSSSS